MTDDLKTRIQDMLGQHKVLLFMKGTKAFPQCGFSNRVVQVLKAEGVTFETFNILSDQEIREGLKEFSNWPTFPQLYVNGKLVGGCDIVSEMHQNGELKTVLAAS